jgi:hypothetical protein
MFGYIYKGNDGEMIRNGIETKDSLTLHTSSTSPSTSTTITTTTTTTTGAAGAQQEQPKNYSLNNDKRSVDRYFIEERGNTPAATVPLAFLSKEIFAQNCTLCGANDHEIFDCTQRFCALCNRKGHEPSVCPNKESGVVCEWCSKYGHIESTCPLKEYIIDLNQMSEENLRKWNITKLETKSGYLCCELPTKKTNQIYCFNCAAKHSGLQCEQPSLTSMMNNRSTQNKIVEMGVTAKSQRTKKLVHHLVSQFTEEY